jgi:hypothetical protein
VVGGIATALYSDPLPLPFIDVLVASIAGLAFIPVEFLLTPVVVILLKIALLFISQPAI